MIIAIIVRYNIVGRLDVCDEDLSPSRGDVNDVAPFVARKSVSSQLILAVGRCIGENRSTRIINRAYAFRSRLRYDCFPAISMRYVDIGDVVNVPIATC